MDKVYICHTYYQVYITIVKEIKAKKESDIILTTSIPNVESLKRSLEKSKIFNDIIIFPEIELKEKFYNEHIESLKFRGNKLIDIVERQFKIYKNYKNIYIYNDWTIFGCYIMDKKIKYHLIEDGLDGFYYLKGNLDLINKKYFNKIFYPNFIQKIKKSIKKILNCGYEYFGTSKYAIDIEVNDISKIFIPHNKVIEVPKKELLKNLTINEKKEIYDIFINENIDINIKDKKLLLLTQPLIIDRMVSREEYQIKAYIDILNKYGKGYKIYIKPHPRDCTDYKKYLKKYNVTILSKNMPTEILDYNENVKFDLGITITSSSIRGMKCIEEKIELGFEYLDNYKD